MTIYYIYEKATGKFAGSGTVLFDDEVYGSTETPATQPEAVPVTRFDVAAQTWNTSLAPADDASGTWLDNLPMTGDVLTFDGVQYESLIDNNVWTPDAYPMGWRAVADTGGEWAVNTDYAVDDQVTYEGSTYTCLQAHTSQVGWEPPNVPALWSAA